MTADANADANSEGGPVAARAGTVTAIATMGLIALVCAVAVIAWARLGGGAEAEEDGLAEPIPSQMAGGARPGRVPPAVVDVFGDTAVVGVAMLDSLPPGVERQCNRNMGPISWEAGEPSVEYAYAGPDAISLSLIGRGEAPRGMFGRGPGGQRPERFRLICIATDQDGGWVVGGGGIEPAVEGHFGGGEFGGGAYTCCDENGLASASGSVAVPDGATWALQERNGWYLAYPVSGTGRITVTWKYREQQFGGEVPPQSAVTFVDDSGAIVGEDFAGGQF